MMMLQLSRREREVVALVAEGLTNREIAQQLFISERTVEGHVENVLNKLGFQRRVQIAIWTRIDTRFEHPGNVPGRVTSFVGRQRELDELHKLLGRARLVTIAGPGGIGKTRLALELASTAAGKDGAWFVDLAPLTSGDLVWEAAAAALGVRESPAEPLRETVLHRLAGCDSLVVLDNCEHVVDAAALAAETLLRHCTRVRVLATSREPLGVYGELTWRAPVLRHEDAVGLFNDRAGLAAQGAAAPPETVAELVGRLDHLPLAIELAAARVAVLTPEEILARLDDALGLLTGGARTAAPRQQTLKAMVDWSYDLLEPAQRRLFERLSVFAGSFDLTAAQAVQAVEDGPVLDRLAGLVDRSLVIAEPRGNATHYRLLEVLRQYGWAQLAESGDLEEVRRRHAEHYLKVAWGMDRSFRVDDQGRWLAQMRQQRDNFRLALEWARDRPPDFGLRLATHLARFWTRDGWAGEGSAWMEQMLAGGSGDRSLLATALHRAGGLANLQGDYETAWERVNASLAIKRELGDTPGAARRLNLLSIIALARGELTTAQQLAAEALEISTAVGEPRGVAWATLSLGYTAFLVGDSRVAADSFRRALAIHRGAADHLGVVYDLSGLIWLDLEAGDVAAARVKFREGVDLLGTFQGTRGERGWLLGGMVLAAAEGRDVAVLRLAGAIDATERGGLQLMAAMRARYQPVVDRSRARVGEPEAATLMLEGAAMTVAELVHEILGDEEPGHPGASGAQ